MDQGLVGARLGAYRVGRLLGEGGMGAVYEGVQEALGRPVAIKVLKTRGEISAAQLERFGREAHAAAALGHPNIVQVTDFQPSSSPPFLVMERLTGESLREAIAREGRLPTARVAAIGAQLLDALGAAHAAGIVHRDIKPDNVFLTRIAGASDLVKVLDFGVAKLTTGQALTALGASMGSPAYMSPEQALGRAVDHRSDLWCAGATLYQALCGRLPFETDSLGELMRWIPERPHVPLARTAPGIDPRMVAVIDRALEKDPARRFQSAAEMQAALAPLLPRGGPATALAAPLALGPPEPPRPVFYAAVPTLTTAPVTRPPSGSGAAVVGWLLGGLGLLGFLGIAVVCLVMLVGARRPPEGAPQATASAAPTTHGSAHAPAPVPTAYPGLMSGAFCTATRIAPVVNGLPGNFEQVTADAQIMYGATLAQQLGPCRLPCPMESTLYHVRVNASGAATEARLFPVLPACPARDACVDKVVRGKPAGLAATGRERIVELSCVFLDRDDDEEDP